MKKYARPKATHCAKMNGNFILCLFTYALNREEGDMLAIEFNLVFLHRCLMKCFTLGYEIRVI